MSTGGDACQEFALGIGATLRCDLPPGHNGHHHCPLTDATWGRKHICPPCARGDHHACSEPGMCECTINPDTGEDEGLYCDLCPRPAVWINDLATVLLCAEHAPRTAEKGS